MAKGKVRPLVLVEWEDSARPEPGWHFLSDIHPSGPVKCQSVGWLLSDDGDEKVLAPNMGDTDNVRDAQACGFIRIPSRAVTRIARLKKP